MNIIEERRQGKFHISHYLIKEHPNVVRKALSKVLIVRAESHFMYDQIVYYGYSEEFEPVPLGTEPPRYIVEVTVNKVGNQKISFKPEGK